MKGAKEYFPDELNGTNLQIRTHIDTDGDLWLAILEDYAPVSDSVLLSKSEALRLANVLLDYEGEWQC